MLLGVFVSFYFILFLFLFFIFFVFFIFFHKIEFNLKFEADTGFGVVGKVDPGYYAQGFFFLFFSPSNLKLTYFFKKRSLSYIKGKICREILPRKFQSVCDWVCGNWEPISCD